MDDCTKAITVSITEDGELVCKPLSFSVTIEGSFKKVPFVLELTPKQQGKYEFPRTGAVVMNGNTSQFPGPSVTENSTSAFIYNASSVPGIFNYTVYVQEKCDGRIRFLRVDPTIENER